MDRLGMPMALHAFAPANAKLSLCDSHTMSNIKIGFKPGPKWLAYTEICRRVLPRLLNHL
jgi:hypothetical protein